MSEGKTYLMFKTGYTDLESLGLTNVLERTSKSVAKYYLMNYNEEDLPRIRGGSGQGENPGYDTILENNTMVKNIINNVRNGSESVVKIKKEDKKGNPVEKLGKKTLSISDAEQMKEIKIALFKGKFVNGGKSDPNYDLILAGALLRDVTIDMTSNLPKIIINPPMKLSEYPEAIFCPPSADPDKPNPVLSYQRFKEWTPSIWEEMEKYYNELKTEFEGNIDRLSGMRLPGVNAASTFKIEDFSVDALKRSTHDVYMANSFGVQQVLKMYLPMIFSEGAITKEEANSIANSFGIGMTEGILDLAKNAPNFHGFFARPHGITRMDTICNFMKLFNVICSYGEKKKFKGGLYNLKQDPVDRYLKTSILDQAIKDKMNGLENDIRENIFKHITDGMIGGKIKNPISVVATYTGKGDTTFKRLFGKNKASRTGVNVDINGAAFLNPLKISKIKTGIIGLIEEISDGVATLSPGFTISIDLPAGKYVYK